LRYWKQDTAEEGFVGQYAFEIFCKQSWRTQFRNRLLAAQFWLLQELLYSSGFHGAHHYGRLYG
jgi:hypothetical protein